MCLGDEVWCGLVWLQFVTRCGEQEPMAEGMAEVSKEALEGVPVSL